MSTLKPREYAGRKKEGANTSVDSSSSAAAGLAGIDSLDAEITSRSWPKSDDGIVDTRQQPQVSQYGSQTTPQNDTAISGGDESLPELRHELRLEAAQFNKSGQPKWTLHDPVKGKYYRLGWLEFELLSRWQIGSIEGLIQQTNQQTTLRVDRTRVDNLISMLRGNELIRPCTNEELQRLRSSGSSPGQSLWKSAFRFSMFYRKPLVNPDAFLTALDRFVSPLYSMKRLLVTLWVLMVVTAVYGVAAHWFEFKSTFTQFMTVEGFALFAVVLLLINCLHEIGHGLVAKHYQCRVTEMGVALIFMLPVCYCDTSDTWRLTQQRKRLMVSAGGLLMELGIATVACLFWLILPDGIPRTLMFFMAATSLLTTLFVNLNPFMKFDGYYLLSDYLGVDNLQTKSFSNFRWQLRRWLLGTPEPRPYRVPESSHTVLNCYAVSTWIYRLLLYFTICWMVYQFWFKALGLMLMAGVFITMIVTPVVKESAAYAAVVKKSGLNKRSMVSAGVFILLIGFLLVPLPRKVSVPALLGSEEVSRLFATTAAQVSELHVQEGQEVAAGQKILTLIDPELKYQEDSLLQELDALKLRKRTEAQWLSDDQSNLVTNQDITAAEAALLEVRQKIALLDLTASADAVITSLPEWIKPGVWVDTNTVLVEFASRSDVEVRAYVPASKRDLIDGDSATFFANVGGQPVDLTLKNISDSNVDVLEDHSLAVINGGEVAVSELGNGELQPLQGRFLAALAPVDLEYSINKESTGYVMFSASAQSLMSSAVNRLYGVVIRESGF